MSYIQLKNLSHSFGHLKVLDNISTEINEGELISIIGPSGCGKTTLLKILCGLFQPGAGHIIISSDRDRKSNNKNHNFGFVFQNPTLLPWLTVKQNIALPLEIKRMGKTGIHEILRTFKLERFANFFPNQISGGMRQRAAIARALIYKPDIILMDEPFKSLDEISREELNIELLSIYLKYRKTIIFVTHSIQEAVFLSGKIIIMSDIPARIFKEINIDFSYPRDIKIKNSRKFINYLLCIRRYLIKH